MACQDENVTSVALTQGVGGDTGPYELYIAFDPSSGNEIQVTQNTSNPPYDKSEFPPFLFCTSATKAVVYQ